MPNFGGKQNVLWEMCKWRIGLYYGTNFVLVFFAQSATANKRSDNVPKQSHSAIRHHTSPVSNVTSKWPNQRESFANRSRKSYEGKLFDSLFLIERVCYAVLHLVKMSQIMEFSLRCHKNWVSKPLLSK